MASFLSASFGGLRQQHQIDHGRADARPAARQGCYIRRILFVSLFAAPVCYKYRERDSTLIVVFGHALRLAAAH